MPGIKSIWIVAHVSDSDTEILVYNDFQYEGYSVHYELFWAHDIVPCCSERLD